MKDHNTGLTRAKQLAILVGPTKAIRFAITRGKASPAEGFRLGELRLYDPFSLSMDTRPGMAEPGDGEISPPLPRGWGVDL